MKNIIQIKHLSKSYGDVLAINDLSFEVKEGEMFAFLGVNGAGKSTTINIMCTSLNKDEGEVFIDGYNLDRDKDKIKRTLGVVFQDSFLDSNLTVYDNLEIRASLYNLYKDDFKKRLNELVDLLDLKELLNRRVGKLSGGQKRRIDIARALIHKPKILILDEPTTGLDPKTRKKIWQVVFKLKQKYKMTIFLTTHYMEEASDADYVIIIDKGQVKAEGTPHDLKNKYTLDFITIYNVCEDEIKKLNLKYYKIKDGYKLEVKNTALATKLILENKELFKDYEITKGKMDDVFLNVTGKDLEGEEDDPLIIS